MVRAQLRAAPLALAAALCLLLASPTAASELQAMQLRAPQHAAAPKLAVLSLLVVTYISLNSSLNLLNKWSLGVYGFRFPLLLTSCHMAVSFGALAPLALRQPWKVHRHTLAQQWRGVACIGAFMALNIALNNISLLDISLTLNQIIRSAIPVVTCALAVAVERKRPTRGELTALVVLTAGVMAAVWQQGRLSGRPHAVLFCAASTVCSGAMMTLSGKLLSEKMDVVRLTFYTAPVSLLCLAPFCWAYERRAFLRYLPEHRGSVAAIVLLTSANAVAYNLVHSAMIQRAGAVAVTVLGECKILLLLALSAAVLGEAKEFSAPFSLACAAAMAGFALYSHAQIAKLRGSMEPAVVSVVAAGGHRSSSSSSNGGWGSIGGGGGERAKRSGSADLPLLVHRTAHEKNQTNDKTDFMTEAAQPRARPASAMA